MSKTTVLGPIRAGVGVCVLSLGLSTGVGVGVAAAQCGPVWVSGIGSPGVNGTVDALAVLPGGDVVVGGTFTTAGGNAASNIARYNPRTGVWSAMGAGANRIVSALVVLPDGDLIVGGNFTSAGGVAATQRIARYNPATGVWSSLGTGPTSAVYGLTLLPDGDVLVMGAFGNAGGISAGRVARLNPVTRVWSALGSGTGAPVNEGVWVAGEGGSVDVIVGGSFTGAGGQPGRNHVARFTRATGLWSGLGTGTEGEVECLVMASPTMLVVGGRFGSAGGVTGCAGMARYDLGTGVWRTMGLGVSGPSPLTYPNTFAMLPGGDLIVGGNFVMAGGLSASYVARVNPNTAGWQSVGAGTNGPVRALAVHPSGDVYVGGNFEMAGGVAAGAVACFSPGGAPGFVTQPRGVTVCAGGDVSFEALASGRGPLAYQWRKNAETIDWAANPSAATATLILAGVGDADAGVYDCVVSGACGSVTSVGATLTILSGQACCAADFNGDGFLDFFDYNDFVIAFEAGGGLVADFNQDGFVDFFDYADFVEAFEIGC